MSKDQKKVILQELMTELTKKNSQTKNIRHLCNQLGIPFNGDIIELMTYVLGSDLIQKPDLKTQTKIKKKNHEIIY
ncbi:MAG: hypothetical protein ACK4VO_01055 [Pseudobdellovibrio sp.]